MKILSTIIFIFLISNIYGQKNKIEYFDEDWNITSIENAVYFRETSRSESGLHIVKDFYMDATLQMNGSYSDRNKEIKEGLFEYFNENGDTSSIEYYSQNKLNGIYKQFYEGNKLESIANYSHGERTGLYQEFYENGILRGETNFVDGNIRGTAKKYYPSGKLGSELNLDSTGTGTLTTYFETGEKLCNGNYTMGFASGNWTRYNNDGTIKEFFYVKESDVHQKLLLSIELEQNKKRKKKFKNYKTIEGAVYDFFSGREIPIELPQSTSDEIVDFPDVQAEFTGGVEAMQLFIAQNVKYPEKALKKNITSRTYVSFVVEPDGTITNVKYVLGHAYFEKEAVRLVKSMPLWKPGEAKGKKARTRCRLPINFTLN